MQIRGKRILITGGAGFIGATLIGRLVEKNKIAVFDNFRRDALSGKDYSTHPNLTIIRGDVLDYSRLRQVMSEQDPQIVVHCAAIAGIDTVIKSPTETMRVNLLGTAFALQASHELRDLQRFVDFSTSEVFGESAFRVDENMKTHIGAVGEARWTYAASKVAGEHFAHAYYREFHMPTVIVRPFNVYGPGQVGEGALRTFILRAIKNEEIEIHGDGNQIRAWCYIDDFIDGLLLCLLHPKAVGQSFNIGNARAVITIYGLAQTVVRILASKSEIRFAERRYTDIELRVPSVDKARRYLGFEAKVDLEEGIRRTAAFYGEAAK